MRFQPRFDNCVDPSGFQHSCHYTTHYSNAAVVLHYLIRIDPFTSLHINLQGGKFDLADRQFLSIFKTWKVIQEGRGDIREMIPEFFCFPNFLMNINNLDLGRLQVNSFLSYLQEETCIPSYLSFHMFKLGETAYRNIGAWLQNKLFVSLKLIHNSKQNHNAFFHCLLLISSYCFSSSLLYLDL